MRILLYTTMFVSLMLPPFAAAQADEYSSTTQLKQIKVTKAVQDFAGGGKGITIGIVDTGINPSHSEFKGRVSGLTSTCVATGNCAGGYLDTNFHGTFVASVAAAAANGTGMVGVAPQSNLIAVKIAQANGSAYTTDLNNGLLAAANKGAQVINLSYGSFYGPKSTSSYAYYNGQLVKTLNAVAAKGSVTAIAGGNSKTLFMDNVNQGGFTSAALSRLIFVGSVDKNNNLSSFSNTPGTTKFTTLDNKTVPLNSLWIMAPGENIVGAYFTGNNSYALGNGTSFAAPQVSGALALLESRWPVLYKNGLATKVLLTTATDLGAKGIDNIYGAGLMNVEQAFQPIGDINVKTASGGNLNVTKGGGTIITSKTFGNLPALQSSLSNMTGFDSYGRDFAVNLSSTVKVNAPPPAITSSVGTKTTGTSVKFTDGGTLSYAETVPTMPEYFTDARTEDQSKDFYLSMTDKEGTTTAGGYGYSAAPSFTDALWNDNEAAKDNVTKLGLSNDLLSLAQGGGFLAYGEQINSKTRYALSLSQTEDADNFVTSLSKDTSSAKAIGVGIKHKIGKKFNQGVTFNLLDEDNQWLGATYSNSYVGLGAKHRTMSLGLTSSYDLAPDQTLVFDTSFARGKGVGVKNSLVDRVSNVYAQSMGVTFTQKNAIKKDDKFTVQLKQPLRLFKGSARVTKSSVDSDGNAVTSSDAVALTPNGRELNLSFGYTAPVTEKMSWSANLTGRKDEDNIRGNNNADFVISAKITF